MQGDLHITNARIWTALPNSSFASSLTIRGGTILAVNTPPSEYARIINAHGLTILPGFIDSHLHLLMAGRALNDLDLSLITSRAEFESAIAARHAQLKPGQWLIARAWSQVNWAGSELPTKHWLRAAGDRPCVCYRMDLHAAVVNDAVLDQIDTHRPVTGGKFERDSHNQLTGIVLEAALWERINPVIPDGDLETKRAWLSLAMQHANRLGLTAVGTMEYQPDIHNIYCDDRSNLTLRCKCIVMDRAWPMSFDFGQKFASDDFLAVVGYKAFADGTLGSRTARMFADYADDPGNRGMLVELAAKGTLSQWAHACAQSGMSPCIHAIGDEAAHVALHAIENIHPELRPRIEHAQQLSPEDFPRFRDVIASMQPLHKADDGRYVTSRVGPDRLAGTFAFRSLKRAGARLAFGSDWPVVSCDPMLGIRAAVTGLTLDGKVFKPEENLTVEESLRAYTVDAAYAIHLDRAGLIAPGALADLVMLDKNPFDIDWSRELPKVVATMVDGEFVYDAR
ncbi:MAG TPA: amidohydrolase [Phycisphaerales bacterium]|nr:amidohydrolase [Phycisphaerales bacterium]